jgi:hypothetical protein
MTKLLVAFRNFGNAPEKLNYLYQYQMLFQSKASTFHGTERHNKTKYKHCSASLNQQTATINMSSSRQEFSNKLRQWRWNNVYQKRWYPPTEIPDVTTTQSLSSFGTKLHVISEYASSFYPAILVSPPPPPHRAWSWVGSANTMNEPTDNRSR